MRRFPLVPYSPNAPGGNPWLTPTGLVQPRFARLQVQVDF
jgi:hypothetical protein